LVLPSAFPAPSASAREADAASGSLVDRALCRAFASSGVSMKPYFVDLTPFTALPGFGFGGSVTVSRAARAGVASTTLAAQTMDMTSARAPRAPITLDRPPSTFTVACLSERSTNSGPARSPESHRDSYIHL
jgi:hypothetical protein